jgi:eukaryotic-like serine/threonine-protein kinase
VPLTQTGSVVGTAYYLSPEQAAGQPVTPASDLYSLGAVAYECLAGARPFPGNNPLAVAQAHLQQTPPPLPADVPPDVAALVMRMLDKDAARRPASAGELAREAFALRGGPTSPSTRVLPVVAEPAARRPHGHRWAVRLASAVLALVVVALFVRACAGPAEVLVPAVAAGTSVDAATAQLGAAHLDALRTTHSSTTVPAGRVIGTDPAAGTKVKKGADITLVVSSGRPKVTITSSSYVGKSPSSVQTTLRGLGLVPTLAYDGTGTPAGTVSGVSPAGSLTYGTAVTVHVVPVPVTPSREARKKHGKHD